MIASETEYRVWHIPQVPGEPFYVRVEGPQEAKRVLAILADYDLFQHEHRIKPDYSNAAGLEVLEDGEWVDWCDDEGNTIDEVEF